METTLRAVYLHSSAVGITVLNLSLYTWQILAGGIFVQELMTTQSAMSLWTHCFICLYYITICLEGEWKYKLYFSLLLNIIILLGKVLNQRQVILEIPYISYRADRGNRGTFVVVTSSRFAILIEEVVSNLSLYCNKVYKKVFKNVSHIFTW